MDHSPPPEDTQQILSNASHLPELALPPCVSAWRLLTEQPPFPTPGRSEETVGEELKQLDDRILQLGDWHDILTEFTVDEPQMKTVDAEGKSKLLTSCRYLEQLKGWFSDQEYPTVFQEQQSEIFMNVTKDDEELILGSIYGLVVGREMAKLRSCTHNFAKVCEDLLNIEIEDCQAACEDVYIPDVPEEGDDEYEPMNEDDIEMLKELETYRRNHQLITNYMNYPQTQIPEHLHDFIFSRLDSASEIILSLASVSEELGIDLENLQNNLPDSFRIELRNSDTLQRLLTEDTRQIMSDMYQSDMTPAKQEISRRRGRRRNLRDLTINTKDQSRGTSLSQSRAIFRKPSRSPIATSAQGAFARTRKSSHASKDPSRQGSRSHRRNISSTHSDASMFDDENYDVSPGDPPTNYLVPGSIRPGLSGPPSTTGSDDVNMRDSDFDIRNRSIPDFMRYGWPQLGPSSNPFQEQGGPDQI